MVLKREARKEKEMSHRLEKDRRREGRKVGIVLSVFRLRSETNENEFQLLMIKKSRQCKRKDDTLWRKKKGREGKGGVRGREQSVSELAMMESWKCYRNAIIRRKKTAERPTELIPLTCQWFVEDDSLRQDCQAQMDLYAEIAWQIYWLDSSLCAHACSAIIIIFCFFFFFCFFW